VLRHPAPQVRPFTVVEVGCGFCYWTVSALLAVRRRAHSCASSASTRARRCSRAAASSSSTMASM
jgi:hypothetical protein